MTEQTLYEILGAQPGCDAPTLRSKYRKLCQKYHPDKPEGDVERFKQIKHAYEVLSDPEKRERYDATGEHNSAPAQDPVQQIVLQAFMKAIEKIITPSPHVNSFHAMMQPGQFEGDVIHDVNEQIKVRVKELTGGITSIRLVLKEIYKIQGKVKRDDDKANLFENLLQQKVEMGRANIESLKAELKANQSALEEINHYRDTGASKRITQAFEQQGQSMAGLDTRGL